MARRFRRQPRSTGRQQRGYMLLAASLGLIIFSVVIVMGVRMETQRAFNERATADGAEAAQFAIGLRGFIAAIQADPALIPAGTRTGVDWLKAPACGGLATNPPAGYVPCSYRGGRYGANYQTTFAHDPATNALAVRTTFQVPPLGDNPRRRIMYAERLVAAALAAQTSPANSVFFTAFANTPAAATGPGAAAANPGANAGRVVMLATNAPTNDLWLRTDGTNHMEANLNMGGMSIGNALDGRFSGNLRVDGMAQVSDGLTVTSGTTDLRGGLITNEAAITSIGKYVSEGIYHAEVYTGSTAYTITKPNCSQAGNNPGIYAVMQGSGTPNSAGYMGDALYESRVDVINHSSTWEVIPVVQTLKLDLLRQDDDLVLTRSVEQVHPANMRVLVMTRCR